MNEITITLPDDWHLHLRDGESLKTTVAASARSFGRAIVMPNLQPPVTSTQQAAAYRQRILAQVPQGSPFTPLMTLYLTDNTHPTEIASAMQSGFVYAAKLYPAGATTNSDSGVTNVEQIYPVLEAMQKADMPLLVHGEVTQSEVDIFDREAVFIETILSPLKKNFPELRIVLEHITTEDAVQFVDNGDDKIAATITAHHLLFNRNHMLVGGIKPHYYCLPVLKRNQHQNALIKAATSGNPRFFLGTDSAPHRQGVKESTCGCAGCYTAPAAVELYTEVFDQQNALNKLEAFTSFHGPDFYKLPRNTQTITLIRKSWKLPETYTMDGFPLVPLCAGEEIDWQILT